MVHPGTVLLGKYRVERILGTGGMGVVALVHHLHLDEPMAMKFLQPQAVQKPEVVQRFLREAQAAVKLKDEHICRIFDVGTLASGAPYMVMEYLEGLDLGDFIRQYGVQSVVVTVDIALQACQALAEAHAMGIVHRDVKPANFFLTQRSNGSPLVKLLDFGISKASAQDEVELTAAQTMLGTPAYMSPEQMRSSKGVDSRTDIWALGVILYELSSGRRPFTGETFSALCLKVALEPVPPLPASVPRAFAQVVMRCLQKEPAARFQTVRELASALEPYHQGSGSPFVPITPRVSGVLDIQAARPANPRYPAEENARAVSTTLSSGTGHVPGTRDTAGRSRMWLLAGLSLVLVGVAVAVFFVAFDKILPADRRPSREQRGRPIVGLDAGLDAFGYRDAAVSRSDAAVHAEPALERELAAEPIMEFEPDETGIEPQPSEPSKSSDRPDQRKSEPEPSTPKKSKRGKSKPAHTGATLPWE